MNRVIIRAVIVLFALSTMSACRLMKVMKHPLPIKKTADTTALKIITDSSTSDAMATENRGKLITALQPLWNKQWSFVTFTGRAKMHYEGPDQKVDFIASIRIRKDSVIWINISASLLGIPAQVGRILITPDSLKWVNHLQKEVTLLPLSEASKLLPAPIDFSTLQNFILGDALNKSGTITDASILPTALAIQVESDSMIQRITYNIADSTIANAQMAMRNNFSLHGITQFVNYVTVTGRRFSFDREANIQNAGKQYYLGIDFQNAEFDQQLDYPFSIPRNFEVSH